MKIVVEHMKNASHMDGDPQKSDGEDVTPVFDLACHCGWTRLDTYVVRDLPVCPECGEPTFKLWRSFPALIDDTIRETIHNLAPQPITFTSRSEKRLYLKQHGIRESVRHVGTPGEGSDRSPHTSRWI